MITTKGFFMSHSESFKYQIVTKYLCGKLHRKDAATLLNVSPRTMTRYSNKIKKLGMIGVKHGNSGSQFNKKHSPDLILKIKELYKGNRPLCNYLAMFRTDLKSKTRVFVLEAEVEMNEIKDFRRYRKQRSAEDELREQQKAPLGLSDDLYIKMYNLILDVGNAVKKH